MFGVSILKLSDYLIEQGTFNRDEKNSTYMEEFLIKKYEKNHRILKQRGIAIETVR